MNSNQNVSLPRRNDACPNHLVKAEGIDYMHCKCTCKDDKIIIVPTVLNKVPGSDSSVEALSENLRSLSISPVGDADSKTQACYTRNREQGGPSSHSPNPASLESDFQQESLFEQETNQDALNRCHQFKKALIRSMQKTYNEDISSPGRLTKCNCNSCWAENILLLTDGSIRPMGRYHATRTADKCENIRSLKRVRFNKVQKTLTYDISDGAVFDFKEGKTDFSCVKKRVGIMQWEDSDSEDSDDDVSESGSSESN